MDDLASRIDHTVLGPETTLAAAERVAREATDHGMNACVPPCYVPDVVGRFDCTLVTVVGFPHGQEPPAAKVAAAERAWEDGADEIDVVLNVGRFRDDPDRVRDELEAVVGAVPLPTKVILQTGRLAEAEMRQAATLCREAGADYCKTSTGFGPRGATVADVELLAPILPVKASGGVRTAAEARRLLDAGAARIGTSSGVEIVTGE